MGKFIDLTGQRFGRLVVIKRDGITKSKHTRWKCKCDCGNIVYVSKINLKNKSTKSCGCLKKEKFKNLKHQKSNSKIYYVFNAMKARCYNKNNFAYKYYGARGIKICPEWLDKDNGFINFYNWAMQNGYQDNLTIDRIDVNGNYEPNNCRWVTMKEQANNKRNNYCITYNGETHNLTEWSKILNINYSTLHDRLHVQNKTINELLKKENLKIKKVNQYNSNGDFIKKWNSISEIKKMLGFNSGYICMCCKNKKEKAYNFIWRYADEDNH